MNGQEKCYKYYQITRVGFGTKGKKSIGQTILKAKKNVIQYHNESLLHVIFFCYPVYFPIHWKNCNEVWCFFIYVFSIFYLFVLLSFISDLKNHLKYLIYFCNM